MRYYFHVCAQSKWNKKVFVEEVFGNIHLQMSPTALLTRRVHLHPDVLSLHGLEHILCFDPISKILRIRVWAQTSRTKTHLWPYRERKITLTFSAQAHGLSIFPEVFETFLRFSAWKWDDPTQRHMNSCTCSPACAVATSSVSSYSTKTACNRPKKRRGGQDWQLSRSTSLSRTQFGKPGNSPSPPWSLALSTQLLHGCPSIISGLGSDLRSAAVAIAVEPSPRWICCCCFSCCLAARRCSPLTSSSALSDILSARM